MNTIREIAEVLAEKNRILIFPHVHMDGDALGSAVALCSCLRKAEKKAYIVIEDDIADNIEFLAKDYCVKIDENMTPEDAWDRFFEGEKADLCICVDCGGTDRFEKRAQLFLAGEETACVDHHGTSSEFACYNYIDGNSAACAEIIFDIVRELEDITGDELMGKEAADAVFTGIMTDTGCFIYSNTTIRTHEIAIELLKMGVDSSALSANVYESDSFAKIRLNGMAVDAMELFAKGKAAISCVTQEMLEETGAVMNDAEGVVDTLRSIKGVEIAVFLKEIEDGVFKVSMRAKSYANVAEIAAKFGGGGHIRAAGCTLKMPFEDAYETMVRAVSDALK